MSEARVTLPGSSPVNANSSNRMPLELRPADDSEFDFAFQAKRDAIGPHVCVRWGWDETWQLEHHRGRWESKPWQIVLLDSQRIGTVSIDIQPSHLQFGEFYILAPWRNRGLGTGVLCRALSVADDKGIETRVEYLKWNPVASLYRRHGFAVYAENDTHYFLRRAAIRD